jgi:hypothetical protein
MGYSGKKMTESQVLTSSGSANFFPVIRDELVLLLAKQR